jgi:hypothetical protein
MSLYTSPKPISIGFVFEIGIALGGVEIPWFRATGYQRGIVDIVSLRTSFADQ